MVVAPPAPLAAPPGVSVVVPLEQAAAAMTMLHAHHHRVSMARA
jgi:hypothetical protein